MINGHDYTIAMEERTDSDKSAAIFTPTTRDTLTQAIAGTLTGHLDDMNDALARHPVTISQPDYDSYMPDPGAFGGKDTEAYKKAEAAAERRFYNDSNIYSEAMLEQQRRAATHLLDNTELGQDLKTLAAAIERLYHQLLPCGLEGDIKVIYESILHGALEQVIVTEPDKMLTHLPLLSEMIQQQLPPSATH